MISAITCPWATLILSFTGYDRTFLNFKSRVPQDIAASFPGST